MPNSHKAGSSAEKDDDRRVGLFDEAKQRISDLTDDTRARSEKLLGQLKSRSEELWGDAQGRGKDALKGIQTLIQKNPGKAVGYAFAAGAVLSALVVHRRNKR